MKKNLKKILSAVLMLALVVCSVFALDFSAVAAEIDENAVAVEFDGDNYVEKKLPDKESPVVCENPEYEGSTSPTEPVTEPTEEPTTVEPTTVAPTTVEPTTAVPTTTAKPEPVIGNVRNCEKISFETDRITLRWDKISGVTGYSVYYCNTDRHVGFSKVADVTSNSITIKNLYDTTKYSFKIAGYIIQDGKRYDGPAYTKVTATQPSSVEYIKVERSSDVVQLRWIRNSRCTGYKIFRACENTDWDYVPYKNIWSNSTVTFADYNVSEGNQYRYIIKAFRGPLYDDCYYYSEGVSKVAYAGLCAPIVDLTSQASRVSMNWRNVYYADGYEVFYSTSEDGTYHCLYSTPRRYYNTTRLTNGKTYYFRVRPYRTIRVNGKMTDVYGTYYTYKKTVTNTAYGSYIGSSYIEVSLSQQYMWMYKNGELVTGTSVVTGNDDGYHNTPKGAYKIFQKARSTYLYGADYTTYVDYWLGFTYSGCGIHDSWWRSSWEYGGTTYKGNGSHGCVNTPTDKVRTIFNNAYLGMYVVVY